MKKLLACIVAAALLLPGCGPDAGPEEPDGPAQTQPDPDPAPEPEPEPEPEPKKELTLAFTDPYLDLYPGETARLACKAGGSAYDPSKEYKILYKSSNSVVAFINSQGQVTAREPGCTVITATEVDSGVTAERKIWVVNLSQIKRAYNASLQFSCGHTIYYKSVVQSWDFFDDCMYACQVCGSPHTLTYTRKPVHEQDPQEYMHLKYFGHGDNMFVERCTDGDWLWTSNYGTLESGQTNRYTDSQVLSRVRFRSGVTMIPSESTDNYILPGMKRMIAAYDKDNGTVGIWCRDAKGTAWFYVYGIEELKSAPKESLVLSAPISYGDPAVTSKPAVRACNLSNLAPVLRFQMPFNNVTQGYDWHHGKIWFLRGAGAEAEDVVAGTGKNWATAYLIDSSGKKLAEASVPWVADLKLLASQGLTDLGYFEPEGIKVKDGVLFLGFASKDAGNSPARRVNIFKYPLDE